jgi:hypothetical protein
LPERPKSPQLPTPTSSPDYTPPPSPELRDYVTAEKVGGIRGIPNYSYRRGIKTDTKANNCYINASLLAAFASTSFINSLNNPPVGTEQDNNFVKKLKHLYGLLKSENEVYEHQIESARNGLRDALFTPGFSTDFKPANKYRQHDATEFTQVLLDNMKHLPSTLVPVPPPDGQVEPLQSLVQRSPIANYLVPGAPPECLVLQLDRTVHEREPDMATSQISINSTEVTDIERLDLGGVCNSNAPIFYNLKSFVFHKGDADNGHYVAYIRSGDKWFRCDDERVKEVSDLNKLHARMGAANLYFFDKETGGSKPLEQLQANEQALEPKPVASIEHKNKTPLALPLAHQKAQTPFMIAN